MPKLIDLVIHNKNLIYYDLAEKRYLPNSEIDFHESLFSDSSKKLAFLYVDNSLSSIEIFWTLIKSNHAIALLSPQLNQEFKNQLEILYLPDYIWDPLRKEISGFVKNIFGHLNIFKNQLDSEKNIHPELKLLLSTSGTTGSPKFVKLTEQNLVQNALSIRDYLPITKNDITPLNLPIYYSYGLSILTTNSINGGTILCSVKDILNREFWSDLEKYQFSSLAGVPYLYEVLNRIGFTKKKYPSIRYLTQAGGKLNQELVKIFANYAEQNNILFFVMYGQTEATARITFLEPQYLKNKSDSIGKPILNGKFIIDPDTSELIYSGPNVFGGYANCIQDLAFLEKTEQLRTGDIGKVDDEGFYYITGRLKRFLKIFGQRVNLDEVESLLKNAFGGITFICIGINDKYLLVIENERKIQKKIVLTYLTKNLNIHPSFIKFDFLEQIPLTQNGKIDYSKISLMYANY